MPVLVGLLAFGIRAWQPGPTTQTSDESLWLMRTGMFTSALVHGRLADMTTSWEPLVRGLQSKGVLGDTKNMPSSTMPGVTTMWAGTIGRGLTNLGAAVGINDNSAPVMASPQTLRASRLVVSAWCSIAIGMVVALLAWLVGRRAAVVTGILLAVEPFVVGHSSLLHTDAMVAMFGTVAVAALAVALWGRRPGGTVDGASSPPSERGRRWLLVLAGVASGLCVLTKLNGALVVGPTVAIALIVDAVERWRASPDGGWATVRPTVAQGLAVTGVAIATFVVVWPALWVDPGGQIEAMRRTRDIMRIGDVQFFMGSPTRNPDARFYVVTTAFRLSPWLLAGFPVAAAIIVVALVRRWPDRPDPRVLLSVLGGSVVYLVTLTVVGKKFDRYALPVWPWIALVTAVGAVVAFDRLRARLPAVARPVRVAVASVVIAVLAWVPLAQAPYAVSYANPLIGGQGAASTRISLGWGEGIERLGQVIAQRERGHCDDITFAGVTLTMLVALPCRPIDNPAVADPDYIIRYVHDEQLGHAPRVPVGYELLRTVRIGGLPYAQLWARVQ